MQGVRKEAEIKTKHGKIRAASLAAVRVGLLLLRRKKQKTVSSLGRRLIISQQEAFLRVNQFSISCFQIDCATWQSLLLATYRVVQHGVKISQLTFNAMDFDIYFLYKVCVEMAGFPYRSKSNKTKKR